MELVGLSQGVVTGATFAGIVLGLSLVAGLLAGQFRRGVVGELRESLTTANTELDIERKRGDRLEALLARTTKEFEGRVSSLEARLANMETENRVLRETLQTGIRLAPEFTSTMTELLAKHEERSMQMIEHNADVVAARVSEAHEQRVREWNRRFDKLEAALKGEE